MRKLKGDWTDIFHGFSVAFDFKKLFSAYIGLFLSLIVLLGAHYFYAVIADPSVRSARIDETAVNIGLFFAHLILWKQILFYGVLYLVLLIIWAYFGGIISRIAAINLTKDEGLELNKAIGFVNNKYLSFVAPYIFAIFGFVFFFLCAAALGLMGRIPYAGEIIVPLLLPVAFLFGFIMVFIFIGLKFGGALFFPTIAVESSDAFDAVSRSFQYIYAEPWRYIWYCLISLAYGLATTVFVWLFGGLMIAFTFIGLGFGMGDKLTSLIPPFFDILNLPVTYSIGGFILVLWVLIILGLIISYVISYCFSAHTIIYLLLRKRVDDIDMTEIYEDETPMEELIGAAANTDETPKSEPLPPQP